MTWHKRLTLAREARGIKKSHFATLVGVAPSSVTDWENGDTKMIVGENLIKVCTTLQITPEWLLDGVGDLDAPPAPFPDPTAGIKGARRVVVDDGTSPDHYHIRKVKLKLRAGVTGFQTEEDHYDGETTSLPKKWVHQKQLMPQHLISLEVTGESMEPKLYAGDTVIVDTNDKVKKDGEVYAFNYDGESVIKRLVRERGAWWLFSDNSDQVKYRPKGCPDNECIIIGRVVKKESDYI